MSRGTLDTVPLAQFSRTRLLRSLVPAFHPFIPLTCKSVLQSATPHDRSHTVWPLPLSLATTHGISFDFFSWGYLDVSVHPVSRLHPMNSHADNQAFTLIGFPHSDIRGSWDICSSPRLFAAYRVLRRLSVPRHSPCALSNLTFARRCRLPFALPLRVSLRLRPASCCYGSLLRRYPDTQMKLLPQDLLAFTLVVPDLQDLFFLLLFCLLSSVFFLPYAVVKVHCCL